MIKTSYKKTACIKIFEIKKKTKQTILNNYEKSLTIGKASRITRELKGRNIILENQGYSRIRNIFNTTRLKYFSSSNVSVDLYYLDTEL